MNTIFQQLESFSVNRDDDRSVNQLIAFLATNAILSGRKFTNDHIKALKEMLKYDISHRLTDARRIESWLRDNAYNTISRYKLFR